MGKPVGPSRGPVIPPAHPLEVTVDSTRYPVIIECVIPSCSRVAKVNVREARSIGWKEIIEVSTSLPPNCTTNRTHLGWCRDCARKFSVV